MVLDVALLVQKAGAWLGLTADLKEPVEKLNVATVTVSAQAMAVAHQKLLALSETAAKFQQKRGEENENDLATNPDELKAYVNSLKPKEAFTRARTFSAKLNGDPLDREMERAKADPDRQVTLNP